MTPPDWKPMTLAKILQLALSRNSAYQLVREIALSNADGDLWLIGGAVSRTLAGELYGGKVVAHDFDIVTGGNLKNPLIVSDGWSVERSKFGNPTFVKDGVELDLWPIASHEYIQKNNLQPTIFNLFAGVPYTIQVLAFNIRTGELIGDAGIAALRDRVFTINNMIAAKAEAARKGESVSHRMDSKAKSMGFRAILPV